MDNTADNKGMEINLTKIKSGTYQALVTAADGKWRRYKICKREVSNSSARGGAYRTLWTAYTSGKPVGHYDSLADAKRGLLREPLG